MKNKKLITDQIVLLAFKTSEHIADTGYTIWPAEILQYWTLLSEKECENAILKAFKKGYIDYGVSLRAGWITDLGRTLIEKEGGKKIDI